jgi:hypothetical protein
MSNDKEDAFPALEKTVPSFECGALTEEEVERCQIAYCIKDSTSQKGMFRKVQIFEIRTAQIYEYINPCFYNYVYLNKQNIYT